MTNPSLEQLIGATVYDRAGEAIGRVENFYLDNESGVPTWVAMAGEGGRAPTLIPLEGAGYGTDDMSLRVPYAKEQIRTAPHLERDGGIDPRSEQQLMAYYSSGQRRSAGMTTTNTAGRQRIQTGTEEPMTYGTAEARRMRDENDYRT
ncbi:PRC-barrel domain-containing protein [Nocardia acidivorans]|uniref:PRC-barrel domain-containing protein n=1 Tax=Nocardia acidivorans TaxID=404580 RepID=UPI00082B4114|nr:PRC-barrel domain-containing protein [Nocardia acidivorans]